MIDFGERFFEDDKKRDVESLMPDMTPMIDIVFQLLIFFLLTSFGLVSAFKVNLAQSDNAPLVQKTRAIVEISIDGRYSINGRRTETSNLVAELKALKTDGLSVLSLRADRNSTFGLVSAALDAAVAAGIEQVDVDVEPVK